jgi:oxygen-dependent protoporphyrinogen oxidase
VPRDGTGRRPGPIAGRGAASGPAGACARCPRAWPWASRPGSGPRPAPASSGLRGQLGLARDALLPRPDVRGPIGDRSIGPLVARKLGRRVVDTLVDPSSAASTPVRSTTCPPRPPSPRSWRPRSAGAASCGRCEPRCPPPTRRAAAVLGAPRRHVVTGRRAGVGPAARGVDIRLDAPGRPPRAASGGRWTVGSSGAVHQRPTRWCWPTPAPATADLLRPHDDEAAGLLDDRLRLRHPGDVPRRRRRLSPTRRHRVPRAAPEPAQGRDAWAVTACTYLDAKWPHLGPRRGGPAARLARARRRHPRRRLERRRGRHSAPGTSWARSWACRASRWRRGSRAGPDAFPQYRVHHLLRTAGVESALARLGGVAVAGAAYRGVGIPACIASGQGRGTLALGVNGVPRRGRIACRLGRGGRPPRALAPALGMVAPGPGREPGCSTGAWPGCRGGRALVGLAGRSGLLCHRAHVGPRLQLVRRRRPHPGRGALLRGRRGGSPRRGGDGRPPSWPPAPWPRPSA